MSMGLMVAAMKLRVGNPLRKLVLIKLADNASDVGECWPSYQHIADQCEISKRSVMNHITALCDAGLLRKEIRKGGPKGNSSNVYFLTLDGGGAPPAPGVVQQIHQGSAAGSLPSESPAPEGSAAAAPRISNSLEPVIEPVIEPITPQATAKVVTGQVVPFVPQQPRVEIPADMPGPKDQTCKTFKVWANYAMAYRKRYGAWPVWNAKIGKQMALLVDRLGADVAHHVAAHFLKASDAAVLRKCHSVNELLVNAESYHTQWVTGQRVNGTTARQMERTEANLSAAEQAAQMVLAKRQAGDRNEYL
ncbi:helix-turn-helix domain-containing protein [Pseudomonas sp. S1Bt30]|uniref:Helix-turn-helix domain-containing protein n=1 Tax=Pseudomonas quebecensis TaxID=2995174 RepID=A0ABY6QME9_9PSED|nr:helix-turn-helix domain-containing protein [Pseudomonas quebecensis]MCX4067283.1 helix-turn-helix domain-containing protein [Pseudomonas quebecensis]UZW21132.1 helix-turn-helix domain-containing protein [Pseudomonas quebecensis]UZW21450.1 helix-turn-helix domain-containing protein [Pseudomonas quebecensis]UZW26509.1 helix-turn-helix domain-containing protein [Pseudomonas quebecensis]